MGDTFRKMGDGLSHGATTTFEAMKVKFYSKLYSLDSRR